MIEDDEEVAECFALDTKQYTWMYSYEIAKMKMSRTYLACTVFQGRIVVCGGFDGNDYMNSVKAYNYG